jgi:hypothetical protein
VTDPVKPRSFAILGFAEACRHKKDSANRFFAVFLSGTNEHIACATVPGFFGRFCSGSAACFVPSFAPDRA